MIKCEKAFRGLYIAAKQRWTDKYRMISPCKNRNLYDNFLTKKKTLART